MFAIQATKPVFSKKSMKKENKLKFGFPAGIIKDEIIELFKKASYSVNFNEKLQKVEIDDPEIECLVTRPIEIAPFVEKGILDAGIVTTAAVLETKAKVTDVCNLDYEKSTLGKTKLVLAIPKNSDIKSLKDLNGKKIITRVPEITKKFLKENKISAEIIFSDTEVAEAKVLVIADAAVEFTKTGSTLKTYNLKAIKVLMENLVILVTNKKSLENKWKREKIESLGLLLKGARVAQEMVGLMLHASNDMMEEVLKILPALKRPTVTRLRGENWFDVSTVADKKEVRKIIPKLKKIGCTGIIELPLNKVVV